MKLNCSLVEVRMVPNRLNREKENEREVEIRPLHLARSFGSNGLEPYAPLLLETPSRDF